MIDRVLQRRLKFLPRLVQFVLQRIELLTVFRRHVFQDWLREQNVAVIRRVGGAVEEGIHLVIILLRDGIEFVIVARSALPGEAQPVLHRRRRALGCVAKELLGINRSALARGHVAAVVSARDFLYVGAVENEIARELLDGELVKRLITIERADHPVAVKPHLPLIVQMLTVCVAIAREVEPPMRHVFAKSRRRQQARDDLLIRLRRFICEKSGHLLRCRRQPCEIERHTADERGLVCGWGKFQSLLRQPGHDESIDSISDCGLRIADFRQRRFHERLEGPVILVFRALRDPELQCLLLLSRKSFVCLWRRHHFVRIRFVDSLPQFTACRIARFNRDTSLFQRSLRPRLLIQPQITLALLRVRPVTRKTILRKYRPDIAIINQITSKPSAYRCSHNGDG